MPPGGPTGWSESGLAEGASEYDGPPLHLLNCPFVLLDDATGRGRGILYRDPKAVFEAYSASDTLLALHEARQAIAQGHHVAGVLGFEAGLALEPRLLHRLVERDTVQPLVWLGIFERSESIGDLASTLPKAASAGLCFHPRISQQSYESSVAEIIDYIRAGDAYQINFTFLSDVILSEHPLSHYVRLRANQQAGWGAIVSTGNDWLLSSSPELFFSLRHGELTAKPMKGTAGRSANPKMDRDLARSLRQSVKDRAENLMIVDLLRNDLSKIAQIGSVAVPHLYAIEAYPTLYQMTSTVTARLQPAKDPVDILTALFPCGSITGAPKIRAVELIGEMEAQARKNYTGSIGAFDGRGNAAFNVAIRTIEASAVSPVAQIGLGSGIVADSVPRDEWQECLSKGSFLSR